MLAAGATIAGRWCPRFAAVPVAGASGLCWLGGSLALPGGSLGRPFVFVIRVLLSSLLLLRCGLLKTEGFDEGTDELFAEVVEVLDLEAARPDSLVPAGQDFVHG